MKSFIRFLSRNRLYTFIEVTGMAIALAFVMFIATFVLSQFTSDKGIKEQGDIYVGHSDRMFIGCGSVRKQLEGKFPEVMDMCRILCTDMFRGQNMTVTAEGNTVQQNAIAADENFFRFFNTGFSDGIPEDAITGKSGIALSESFANRMFPESSPVGRTVSIEISGNKHEMTVNGVFKDFNNTVLPAPEMIYSIDVLEEMAPEMLADGNGTTILFFRLHDGTDIRALEAKMTGVLKETDLLFIHKLFTSYSLMPFKDIRFAELEVTQPFNCSARKDFVLLFIAAGLLLLVFATLNYLSLTIAQTGFRAKEMATRRLLGAQKNSVIIRYTLESFALTLTASALAIVLAYALAPQFSSILGMEISPMKDAGRAGFMIMAAIVILLSLTSGMIPGIIVAGIKPVSIVKGNPAGTGRLPLRNILMFLQNCIAITTLSIVLAMSAQLRYMCSKPMGYETDGRIHIDGANTSAEYHIDELRQLACVESVGRLRFPPITISTAGASFYRNGDEIKIDQFAMDMEAFDLLGFNVLQKNAEPVPNSMWLTESAMTAMNLGYDCTAIELDNGQIPVCGIISDWHKGSAAQEEKSDFMLCNCLVGEDTGFDVLRALAVKVSGDEDEAVRTIKEFYAGHGLGEDIISVISYNSLMREQFSAQDMNVKLISMFTFLTVLLAALAMLAASTWYSKRMARQTALRKVMGCGRGRIWLGMTGRFMAGTAIAAAAAAPLAMAMTERWLQAYPYRIGNSVVFPIAAAFAVAAVALVTISWQTIRLMNVNPAETLQNE